MVDIIIPSGKYTYNASGKTITLLDEYAGVTVEQIKSIRNLTIKAQYFDSKELYNRTLTMTGAVISGIPGDTAAQNTDKLQIVINANLIAGEPVTLLNAVSLAASASATSTTSLKVSAAQSASLIMKKTGDSTSISYVIYTSPDGVNFDTESYQTFSLAGAGTKQMTRPLNLGVGYIKIKATNDDSTNAGTATAQVLLIV